MGRLLAFGAAGALVALALGAPAAPGGSGAVPLRYIALGDSFSSGEGVPPFRPGTNVYLPVRDTCHRSFRGYPALIAGRRSSPGTWGFWACSGALVRDMTHANHENPGEIAQLDRIAPPGRTDTRVDLVTMTIGGNDAQFGSVALSCVFARIVPGLETCEGDWRARVKAAIARLRTTLPAVYRAVHRRAPKARILVLGYPNPFPASAPQFSKCRLWLEPGGSALPARRGRRPRRVRPRGSRGFGGCRGDVPRTDRLRRPRRLLAESVVQRAQDRPDGVPLQLPPERARSAASREDRARRDLRPVRIGFPGSGLDRARRGMAIRSGRQLETREGRACVRSSDLQRPPDPFRMFARVKPRSGASLPRIALSSHT